MTIKELYEAGEIDIKETKDALYNIGFINSDGDEDETQFTAREILPEAVVEELALLFGDFCAENKFSDNDVLYVEYVGQDTED